VAEYAIGRSDHPDPAAEHEAEHDHGATDHERRDGSPVDRSRDADTKHRDERSCRAYCIE
jgi:hypothetical protein